MVNITNALNAYKNVANTPATTDLNDKTAGAVNVSFSDLVSNAAENFLSTQKKGERATANAIAGTGDLTQVVQAVNDAEVTLQAVVAMRDRAVQAYQEILRMPI